MMEIEHPLYLIYNPNKPKNMGNNICASSRKCQDNGEMFGMLCKRPYDKQVLVKFEKRDTYTRPRRKKKSRKKRIKIQEN